MNTIQQPIISSLVSVLGPNKVNIFEEASKAFKESFAERLCSYAGLETAHVCMGTSDDGFLMAQRAVRAALGYDEIERIICVTQSFYRSPGLGYHLHNSLELGKYVAVIDINSACQGWVEAVALAAQLPGRSLVVTMDGLGSQAREQGAAPNIRYLFSDAASACIVSSLIARTTLYEQKTLSSALPHLQLSPYSMDMDGEMVSQLAASQVPPVLKKICKEGEFAFMHQANDAILSRIETRSGLKTHKCLKETANCTSSSIPVSMANFYDKNLFSPKEVAVCGFGAGFSVAATKVLLVDKPRMIQ